MEAIMIDGESVTIQAAKNELKTGLDGFVELTIQQVISVNEDGIIMGADN